MAFAPIRKYLAKRKRCREWGKRNPHNETVPMNDFDISAVSVGRYTYGGIRVYNFNNKNKLKIGSFCSIADDVMFILDADHPVNLLSTYPFKVKCLKTDQFEAVSKGDIIVDDDVWIGYGATILSGVHIGQGAVIAAGAVVTADVEPYSIVGGVPAKVIKYRFEQDVIDYLMKLNYGALTEQMIREHMDELYTQIEDLRLEDIKSLYSWLSEKA